MTRCATSHATEWPASSQSAAWNSSSSTREALVVAVLGDLGLARARARERGDVAVVGARRREPHGGALERLADELGVGDARRLIRVDVGAELGHDLDEALVAQADQRLADRRAADGEALGQLVLGDALAGGQLGRR